jgi:hypothetical protein
VATMYPKAAAEKQLLARYHEEDSGHAAEAAP